MSLFNEKDCMVLKEVAVKPHIHFQWGVSTTPTTITSHDGLCGWWESQREIPVGLHFSLKLCYMQLPREAKNGRPVAALITLTSSPKTTNCTHLPKSKHTHSCPKANCNYIEARTSTHIQPNIICTALLDELHYHKQSQTFLPTFLTLANNDTASLSNCFTKINNQSIFTMLNGEGLQKLFFRDIKIQWKWIGLIYHNYD